MIINMFSFDNYRWKTFKIKMLHRLSLPEHQPISQLQTLTQHQPLQDLPRKQPQVPTLRRINVDDRQKS
jgi:hypothetical protein